MQKEKGLRISMQLCTCIICQNITPFEFGRSHHKLNLIFIIFSLPSFRFFFLYPKKDGSQ